MAAQQQFQAWKNELQKKLHERNAFTNVLETVESKTKVDRLYIVGGIAGLMALYLIFGHFAELVCNFIGFLFPAYMSIKAIESHSKEDDTQWLTYWVVFALFSVAEFASETIVGYFPIYWLVKCAFLLYLYLPMTLGAQKLYYKFIQPFAMKHGPSFEQKLAGAANRAGEAVNKAYEERLKGN